MATKIRDYAKFAADIREAVGPENIISAANCATRPRLVLKETPSEEVTQQISEMPAVIKVMENGGQYQIVIGTHAKDCLTNGVQFKCLNAAFLFRKRSFSVRPPS